MRTSKVAKRYAQGLLNFTQETGNTTSVFGEMKDLVNTIDKSKDLQSFFNSPIIELKKKMSVADEIFKSFSPVTRNLIQLVIRHGREGQLSNIGQEFVNKVEDMNGVQRITLTSATPLSEENIKNILKSTTLVNHDNQFDVTSIINPDILGGYILRVGDQQIDASVKSKLSRLNKEFQLN
ncbi:MULTISPECIES: ATP synthase F1 subunit delta [unclassified Kaistella]|uniref:ATP synthase F1 subunit delta n=1 Tax=unclassified Kaistella TaxID=2762626 RepID=UPI00273521BB|nr:MULTISPECIES: ATP synthase F1 subunit delta [unclassified Kaistella]MCZ2084029.1 ATP synthase F1 subunit delta [Flavobacteriales bacterium]MDP2454796.1 ATP synthase F1 subunit delta [Kaistella sp. SH11-4b]MDP2457533.1 ATP synthase F1 subunit delta [Kaistella sp. SH40-3]MDP2460293.1 ATP synthase F1 subunit delta [Kaistella sp. SH19-2b]